MFIKKYTSRILFITMIGSFAANAFAHDGHHHVPASNNAQDLDAPLWNAWKRSIHNPTSRSAVAVFTLLSFGSLYARDSKANFKSRFDRSKLFDVKNLWYLYYDKFVGQCHKPKGHPLGGGCSDDCTIDVHGKDCQPHGLLGNLDFYVLKTGRKVLENVATLGALIYMVNKAGILDPIKHADHDDEHEAFHEAL